MLRPATRILLAVEVVVCFGPMVFLLLIGVLLIPLQVTVLTEEPLFWKGPAYILGSVLCGAVGLSTLACVLGKLLFGSGLARRPALICTGIAIGILPIVPFAVSRDSLALTLAAVLPLAASAHILYLASGQLFSGRLEALRSVATATVVVLMLLGMATLDPFGATLSTLTRQQALWQQSAPLRYEYTVKLSGWRTPDDLAPKRIVIENGTVVSAAYLWQFDSHDAGSPAAIEGLWTIERIFEELLAAEQRGGTVSAIHDGGLGFVKTAMIDDRMSRSPLIIEVKDFNVLQSPAKDMK